MKDLRDFAYKNGSGCRHTKAFEKCSDSKMVSRSIARNPLSVESDIALGSISLFFESTLENHELNNSRGSNGKSFSFKKPFKYDFL